MAQIDRRRRNCSATPNRCGDTGRRRVRTLDAVQTAHTTCVLIPVKSFELAKLRLASALNPAARAQLARAMAELVVDASAPLPVWCICEDPAVADWAASMGASVDWTPGLGLNGAVQESVRLRDAAGTTRVVVAHGDLPFATGLAAFGDVPDDEVVLVPDRRGRGTNVISVPTGAGFRFAYGDGSFRRHRDEVERCGLRLRVVELDHLGWDIDEPQDLLVPEHLGRLPGVTS